MQSGGIGLIGGMILLLVVVFIFFIYVGFKSIEFIVTATNLYKKMIKQQTAITMLLIDLRDNTKNFDNRSIIRDKRGDDSSALELDEDETPRIVENSSPMKRLAIKATKGAVARSITRRQINSTTTK